MSVQSPGSSRLEVPRSMVQTLQAIGLGLAVAGLYFGQDILAPLALATLIAFALEPGVGMLQRLRLPRALAVAVVCLAVAAVLSLAVTLIVFQFEGLFTRWPQYQAELLHKIQAARESLQGNSSLRSMGQVLHTLDQAMEQTSNVVGPAALEGTSRVQTVRLQGAQGADRLLQALSPYLTVLLQTGAVMILVVFLLLEWSDLRDRLVRLMGGSVQRMSDAFADAGLHLRQYLGAQFLLNAGHGLVFGLALGVLGVPGALTWGILAGLLRFLPYAGPVLAAMAPLCMALVGEPGWSLLVSTAVVVLVMELLMNNVLEPLVYGQRAGLGTVAILISATFWTALWGPVGLVMALPISVCLATLGRHIPRLAVFNLLLGNRPVLRPSERLYQGLVSHNLPQAQTALTQACAAQERSTCADEVVLDAYRMACEDSAGRGGARRRVRLVRGLHRLLNRVGTPAETNPHDAEAPPVYLVPLQGDDDALAARVLAWCLQAHGVATQVVSHRRWQPGHRARVQGWPPSGEGALVLACSLGPIESGLRHERLELLSSEVWPTRLWLADLQHNGGQQSAPGGLHSSVVLWSCREVVRRVLDARQESTSTNGPTTASNSVQRHAHAPEVDERRTRPTHVTSETRQDTVRGVRDAPAM